jgi:hypothetical protein
MRILVLCFTLAILPGCGIFDRGETSLTPQQVAALQAQFGELTTQNTQAIAALEKTLGAKIVGLETKLDGGAKVTTESAAEEATTAFAKGYDEGAKLGAAVAPGSGWPSALASLLGGLAVGVAGAAGVLIKRQKAPATP